jgi:hypothetical protein
VTRVQSDIEYAFVALALSAKDIAAIVKDTTGVTVDPNASKFLQALDTPQLAAIWNRLSGDGAWRRRFNDSTDPGNWR